MNATQQRIDFLALAEIPNEKGGPVTQNENFLWVTDLRNNCTWAAKLTPSGKIKKNSLRREF